MTSSDHYSISSIILPLAKVAQEKSLPTNRYFNHASLANPPHPLCRLRSIIHWNTYTLPPTFNTRYVVSDTRAVVL